MVVVVVVTHCISMNPVRDRRHMRRPKRNLSGKSHQDQTYPPTHRSGAITAGAGELRCPLVVVGAFVDHVPRLGFILSCEDDVSAVGGSGSGGGFPEPLLGTATADDVLGFRLVRLCCRGVGGGLLYCPSESAWFSLVYRAGVPWDATFALP